MWLHELKQLRLESKQQILLTVEPSLYVLEYERRYILYTIQQRWPILNSGRFSDQKAEVSTIDFLQAPFDDFVEDGWFRKDGLIAFICAW